jgi:predicted nucleic acid-binding protein
MTPVFLDTIGLLASWDAADQWHALAKPVLELITKQRRPIITTTYVLLECGNAAARRPYRGAVARFAEQLRTGGQLVGPTEEDLSTAWGAYVGQDQTGAGIVDHVSFIVMRRLALTDVFSNDKHFRIAGFNTLF